MADFKVTQLQSGLDFENLAHWDVVIIGAGPAGLAASLTTAHRAFTTLVIEAKDRAGGQPQFLYADKRIVDVPGFPDGITGDDLSQSASVCFATAPGISSSKLGQPQWLSNLSSERYSGMLQRRQMKVPLSFKSVSSPANARSVPLSTMTRVSASVSALNCGEVWLASMISHC